MSIVPVGRGGIIHFQPSPVARRLFWHLLGTGSARVNEPQHHDAFALAGATILWLESGQAEMKLESGTYQLQPGPYFWVFSVQQSRWYRPLGCKAYNVSTIRFGGPDLGAWLDELELKRDPRFHIEPPSLIYTARRELARLATRRPPDWELQVHLQLSTLLFRLLAMRKPPVPRDRDLPAPIARVFDAVAMDPDRAWKAADLSSPAGISYRRLRALFRGTLHESIHSFLQKRRLDRARILLAGGELTVKEIAAKLNFGNEYYFSSFFKTQTGYSPTGFRRHLGLK